MPWIEIPTEARHGIGTDGRANIQTSHIVAVTEPAGGGTAIRTVTDNLIYTPLSREKVMDMVLLAVNIAGSPAIELLRRDLLAHRRSQGSNVEVCTEHGSWRDVIEYLG